MNKYRMKKCRSSADTEIHANPMGTIHGGVLCDIADAAIVSAQLAFPYRVIIQ